jgi:hypothetical protein
MGSRNITRIWLSVEEHEKPSVCGIVSSDPDYKLSLKINKRLGISLKNSLPVRAAVSGEEEPAFSKFTDSSAAPDTVFYLVSNRIGKSFLIRILKNIDYLFIVHSADAELSQETIISKLRDIDSVTAVFEIDLRTLKDKNLKYLPQ